MRSERRKLRSSPQPGIFMTTSVFVIIYLTRIFLRSTFLELLLAIRTLSTQTTSTLSATHLKGPHSLRALQAARSPIELPVQHPQSLTHNSPRREISFRTTSSPVPYQQP